VNEKYLSPSVATCLMEGEIICLNLSFSKLISPLEGGNVQHVSPLILFTVHSSFLLFLNTSCGIIQL
jgi:hypothetical protein